MIYIKSVFFLFMTNTYRTILEGLHSLDFKYSFPRKNIPFIVVVDHDYFFKEEILCSSVH